jgi:agmatinase
MGSLVVQVGVRSIDITEAEFMRVHPDLVQTVFADDSFRDRSCLSEVQAAVNGKKVYLSIDVDALDPSVIPATGTPEPGGLQWQDLRDIVAVVAASSHVLAFDCMELSPIPGLNFPDFAAAKLVYETMSAIMGSPSWQDTGLNP